MDPQSLSVLLGFLSIASAIGALLTRDNFYAALYMSVAMLFVAAIYAVYGIQEAVVLIVLVFIGAVGIITIAVAATFRAKVSRKINIIWTLPIAAIAAFLAWIYLQGLSFEVKAFLEDFAANYLLILAFLISATILVMLSTIKIVRRIGL